MSWAEWEEVEAELGEKDQGMWGWGAGGAQGGGGVSIALSSLRGVLGPRASVSEGPRRGACALPSHTDQ